MTNTTTITMSTAVLLNYATFISPYCAAKKLKIRRVGSFKVLNNKVDLSTYEAEVSLQYWTAMLCDLKQQTSVQTIMKTINAARTVLTVKVMAYKNGEGRLRKGELICGSSVDGVSTV